MDCTMQKVDAQSSFEVEKGIFIFFIQWPENQICDTSFLPGFLFFPFRKKYHYVAMFEFFYFFFKRLCRYT